MDFAIMPSLEIHHVVQVEVVGTCRKRTPAEWSDLVGITKMLVDILLRSEINMWAERTDKLTLVVVGIGCWKRCDSVRLNCAHRLR